MHIRTEASYCMLQRAVIAQCRSFSPFGQAEDFHCIPGVLRFLCTDSGSARLFCYDAPFYAINPFGKVYAEPLKGSWNEECGDRSMNIIASNRHQQFHWPDDWG